MATTAQQQERPYITCHVLDTTTGKPAASIAVSLRLLSTSSDSQASQWTGQTNADGRVVAWQSATGDELNAVVARLKRSSEGSKGLELETPVVWSLTFDTGAYFGAGKTFWPEVELRFNTLVAQEEHYHVPLLLGPWSYTTYRGS